MQRPPRGGGTSPAPVDQNTLNARLAVNRFAAFDVASIDEPNARIEFCTKLDCSSSAWVAWNEAWTTKTYTDGSKRYRVPSATEMQLLLPPYDDANHICFSTPIDNTLRESLPEEILGGKGGDGISHFRTSSAKIAVGTDPAEAYAVYALRFLGTEQRAAYFYRWYNTGSETDAYLAIRIKALPDDTTCTLDAIADNAAFWSDDCIAIDLPACGMNFSGSILLAGASGDYWTATEGGLDPANPARDSYAVSLTFTDSYSYVSDANKTNLFNLRMVETD